MSWSAVRALLILLVIANLRITRALQFYQTRRDAFCHCR